MVIFAYCLVFILTLINHLKLFGIHKKNNNKSITSESPPLFLSGRQAGRPTDMKCSGNTVNGIKNSFDFADGLDYTHSKLLYLIKSSNLIKISPLALIFGLVALAMFCVVVMDKDAWQTTFQFC